MDGGATDLKELSRFTDFAALLDIGGNPFSSVQAIADSFE